MGTNPSGYPERLARWFQLPKKSMGTDPQKIETTGLVPFQLPKKTWVRIPDAFFIWMVNVPATQQTHGYEYVFG